MTYLIFNYGTMNSSKSANLLMTSHTMRKQGKHVILMKPSADIRGGADMITSRVGLESVVDIVLLPDNSPIDNSFPSGVDIVLIDEAQFLSVENVERIRTLASTLRIPIICYGLLTDYRSKLFPGSQRLVELADSLKEITYDVSPYVGDCCCCGENKAIVNSKFMHSDDGGIVVIKKGSSIPDIGAEEKYRPMCWSCWTKN